jgi:dolichol-phosphate mannosyltransferase
MGKNFLLSLVVPVYFEEESIVQFIDECVTELAGREFTYEIVFVDDGSKDATVDLIKREIMKNDSIRLIEFSYNQGKEAAVSAGIKFAKGDYILYMDPDLQDPPDEIVNFVDKIQEGYDLVFGVREKKEDTFLNVVFSKVFWFVLEKFTGLDLPKPLAVMRILSRRFANKFLEYGEVNRFIEGIFMDIGMKRTQITVSHRKRFAGKSKYNFKRKMALALKAIFDFSELPLRLATRLGIILIFFSFSAMVSLVTAKILFVDFQAGWPSLVTLLLLGIGIQMLFLGIIGEYVGKIYLETKNRPLYSIKEMTNV